MVYCERAVNRMSLLEITQITKNFGGVVALSNVDFNVEKGEIVGLIGANGAGKTTLFHVISGFYPPTSGTIKFKGEAIHNQKSHRICRKGLVRTFQVVRPFLNMTVLGNVTVGKLFGKDRLSERRAAENEARRILDFVGLSAKSNMLARELTLADHKRLEMARSLATNPELLLLDEVLAGLTPTETAGAMEIVREIRQRMGMTILMVEHVMKAVIGLCDRIVVIHYGRKIAEGTPREIAENQDVIEAYLGESLEA
jgi:branched-chain amino acid transport system ATP-binding protein